MRYRGGSGRGRGSRDTNGGIDWEIWKRDDRCYDDDEVKV